MRFVIKELLGRQPGTVLKKFLFREGRRSWADERVEKEFKLVAAKSSSDHSAFTSTYQNLD